MFVFARLLLLSCLAHLFKFDLFLIHANDDVLSHIEPSNSTAFYVNRNVPHSDHFKAFHSCYFQLWISSILGKLS